MCQSQPTVDLGYLTEPHGRSPSFANIEEEANFWDTHDVTDYFEESTSVNVTVGSSILARMWPKERLRLEATSGSAST